MNPEADFQEDLPFHGNINVISEPPQGLDLEEYVDATKELLANFFTGYRLTEDTDATVKGREAHFLGSTFVQGKVTLRNRQLVVISDGKAFVITATALDKSRDKYKDVFDASLRSFE